MTALSLIASNRLIARVTRHAYAVLLLTSVHHVYGAYAYGLLARRDTPCADTASIPPGQSEETDAFRTTRLDVEDGPEVIVIERK